MKIKPFAVEEWMNEYEVGAKYNIAETCVDSVSLDELFELTGEDKEAFLREFCARRLPQRGHFRNIAAAVLADNSVTHRASSP